MNEQQQTAVWQGHAQQWSQVGPPLKPSPEDNDLMMASLQPVWAPQEANHVAILGVTPELVQLPWPEGVALRAFDLSAMMIAQVWRPHPAVPSSVAQADWQQLPVESGAIQAVVGDGSLNALPSLAAYKGVLREQHRVLVEQGLFVVRCFVRPERAEGLADVAAAVRAGRVGSFHVLKWRLAMSLADTPGASVAVSEIHAAFECCFPVRSQLADITGWSAAQIDTIDVYRGSSTRYNFPTLNEIAACCAPFFEVEGLRFASYELADRCPTVILRRKNL